jgi:hypothetical protein
VAPSVEAAVVGGVGVLDKGASFPPFSLSFLCDDDLLTSRLCSLSLSERRRRRLEAEAVGDDVERWLGEAEDAEDEEVGKTGSR